jgi:hypothetical protein
MFPPMRPPKMIRWLAAATLSLLFPAAASAQTYYVSPSGADTHFGTSTSTAWRTVSQVDRAKLKPGDRVLFQGGATFSDNVLQPGWGTAVSGTSAAPVTFSSYGYGQPRLTQGVWFNGERDLVFQNLALGGTSGYSGPGFQGNGSGITLRYNTITHANLGINAEGIDWTIANNTISATGDSGMLLGYTAGAPGAPQGGDYFTVTGNTVLWSGLNPADTYGTHGIYDKVGDSTIANNTISHFTNEAISVRYHNSTITGNHIAYGHMGLAWFQYDTVGGTSRWTYNTISNVDVAGIFVCGAKEGCVQPLESFQISNNTISSFSGVAMNLQPTRGVYSVFSNTIG